MRTARAEALPRVGLLGNPSDAYGGRALGFTFTDFRAEVVIESAADAGASAARDEPARPLLAAGWNVFRGAGETAELELPSRAQLVTRVATDIPRQVGLAGSSAILVAYLRALAHAFDVTLSSSRTAELALAAEVEELGLRAGPLDRLVQAHEGFLALDCARPFEPASVERLDPALLPPLLVAWDPTPGEVSGVVHEPVWQRWQRGDALVRDVMGELRENCARGRAALEQGEHAVFRALVDRNFDLRASLFAIAPRDRCMIDLGRARGAATKFCGSGGAVVAVVFDAAELAPLALAFESAGFSALVPAISAPPVAEAGEARS